MLYVLALAVAALAASHPTNSGAYCPVTIVEDDAEIRRAIGLKVDGTFLLEPRQAEAPREVLARYLERELRYEKSAERARMLRQVHGNRSRYFWHCGGYTKGDGKYAFCSMFLTTSTEPGIRAKRFPVVFDGGTSFCRVHYSLRIDAVIMLECNGET